MTPPQRLQHFNPALRDRVLARFQKLDLPTYWVDIHPEFTAEISADGEVNEVQVSRPRDAVPH
jgi:hypothetical protein